VSAAEVSSAANHFTRAVDRLIGQVAHWQPGRWAGGSLADATPGTEAPGTEAPGTEAPGADAAPGGAAAEAPGSRADRVYALVQRLADRCADMEQRPHLRVPRLGDLVLPDQVRVTADDLVAAAAGLAAADPGMPGPGVPGPQGAGVAAVLADAAQDVDAVRRTLL
jgi:hypothetical protein